MHINAVYVGLIYIINANVLVYLFSATCRNSTSSLILLQQHIFMLYSMALLPGSSLYLVRYYIKDCIVMERLHVPAGKYQTNVLTSEH